MTRLRWNLSRRAFLASMGALGAALPLGRARASGADRPLLTKAIPGSGERLPVIGMGSWLTFDVGTNALLRAERLEVLRAFFEAGGAMIDSSPMYGSSEAVIGYCLARLADIRSLFSATNSVGIWRRSSRSPTRLGRRLTIRNPMPYGRSCPPIGTTLP